VRCVVDTNVTVSALVFPSSVPRQAFDLAMARGTLLMSWPVLAELSEVLGRPRFRRYVSEDIVRRFIYSLARRSTWVEVGSEVTASRDPKDDKFLSLAMSGGATHIITGDRDLLVLDPFRTIRLLTPRSFLDETACG
jgi:putative PIN family toxin of toxin-antitoxin system